MSIAARYARNAPAGHHIGIMISMSGRDAPVNETDELSPAGQRGRMLPRMFATQSTRNRVPPWTYSPTDRPYIRVAIANAISGRTAAIRIADLHGGGQHRRITPPGCLVRSLTNRALRCAGSTSSLALLNILLPQSAWRTRRKASRRPPRPRGISRTAGGGWPHRVPGTVA